MYFKFHFRRDDPNYYGIETLVKIDLENDKTILNWTELDDKHPLTHVITKLGVGRNETVTHIVELSWDQYSALEIPNLIFSHWENDLGYGF